MFKEIPGTWPDYDLTDFADWIDDEAIRNEMDPVDFACEVRHMLGEKYTDQELADIVREWSFDYALVRAEEAEDVR